MPRWFVNFLRKRRIKKFLNEFANAVDVIVRGVKAGLPLNDCFRIIANEATEPVKSRVPPDRRNAGHGHPDRRRRRQAARTRAGAGGEFLRHRHRHPAASAGGNLSEALGNLSRVLRDRLKMQGKIKAMSREAKASAVIIGSLPVVVMVLVYLTSPDYIMLLFTEPLGNMILAASAIWMAIGVWVMRKMINFDF